MTEALFTSFIPSSSTPLADRMRRDLERSTGDLPVLPRAARDALRLAGSRDLDLQAVVEVAERDPTLAVRFLGVANSPLYFRGVPITSIQTAVTRLGVQSVRDLLYMSVYSGLVFKVPEYDEAVQEVFRHSVLTGRTARRLAEHSSLSVEPEEAFLAGLLHDVGRARCLKLAGKYQRELAPSVEDVLETADALHTEAGASLAKTWNLPDAVVQACRFHHNPTEVGVAALVAAADPNAHLGSDPAATLTGPIEGPLVALDISPALLPAFIVDAQEDAEALSAASAGLQLDH